MLYTGQVVYLCNFCSILMELEFAIRQTHVHELNKNAMKLELASYHESTNMMYVLVISDNIVDQFFFNLHPIFNYIVKN